MPFEIENKEAKQKTSKPVEDKRGEHLYLEACKALGIEKQEYVLSWRYFPADESVTIVTVGGEKISYQPLQGGKVRVFLRRVKTVYDSPATVEKLEPVRVDGISRKKPRPITGAKAKRV